MTDWGTFSLVMSVLFGVALVAARIWRDRRRGSVRPRAWLEGVLGVLVGLLLFAFLVSRTSR